jgi:hypothetical protein
MGVTTLPMVFPGSIGCDPADETGVYTDKALVYRPGCVFPLTLSKSVRGCDYIFMVVEESQEAYVDDTTLLSSSHEQVL